MLLLFDQGQLPQAPVSRFHNRLLLEDMMGIEKDQELVFLIHQSHSYVSGSKETWWSRQIKTIGDDHASERLQYIIFQSNLYWAQNIVVMSNPERESLHSNLYTQPKIARGCTKPGGWGIPVRLATGEQQNILFDDMLMSPIKLQLWAEGKHTTYGRISAKIRQLKSDISLSATTKRLLEESYGDSILCQDICNKYTTEIKARAAKTKSSVVNAAVIPSQKNQKSLLTPRK